MSKFINYIDEEKWIETFTNWDIINYYENISEVFNKSGKVKIDTKLYWMFSTSFYIFDKKYIFSSRIFDNGNNAIMIFYPIDSKTDIFKERKNNTPYLGTLFGSVIQSVKLMLKEYPDINRIIFTAENNKL